MYSTEDAAALTKAMFGCYSIHVPFNCIVQANPDEQTLAAVIVVGKTPESMNYMFGGKKAHQLIMGDAFIRPHVVMDSDHLIGTGLAGLAMGGFDPDGWFTKGSMLIDNLPQSMKNHMKKMRHA